MPTPTFTNLDKIYWPEDDITKGDLIAYYVHVAPVMLPYLKDRPVTMNRHPNGIHGKSFFQKDTSKQKPPDWVKTVPLVSDLDGRELHYILCQNPETLAYVANLGCIEINLWSARYDKPENPDWLVIDLDPQETPFTQVVEIALEVHKLFDKGGVANYCKTSGKRGLHIFVPMGRTYTHEQARQFAQVVATIVQRKFPAITSMERQPAKRRQKIYLDCLQNGKSQTMAAVYSVRPVIGAGVSTPLFWKEVKKDLDPTKFNLRTMPKRIDKIGDAWAGMLEGEADLLGCLEKLQKI